MLTQRLTQMALLTGIAALAGCSTPQTAANYARHETRMLHQVTLGVITDVREVVIDGTPTGQGAAAGALLGGLPGAQSGNPTRAAIGGVLGSLVGQGAEDAAGRRKGVELLVQLDDGSLTAVTQEANGLIYLPGQRVRVLVLNGAARVVHHTTGSTPALKAAPLEPPVPGA